MEQDKLKVLKTLHLLDQIPERQLAALGEFLKAVELQDGQVLFEEGSLGSSLFFVCNGSIRISKRVAESFKDIAILSPGDCFGEMAIVETIPRSARASANGATQVFELARADLERWLKSNPDQAMGIFTELVQVQSQRLRRTSNELALLFDLSSLLLEPITSNKDLLARLLERVVPHLQGTWSAAAYLYNVYNDEMDFIAKRGESALQEVAIPQESQSSWLDNATYYAALPGASRPKGYLLFRSQTPLSNEDRAETGRTLTTVARLLTSAVENIDHRTEEALRGRLKAQSHGQGI